MSDTLDNLSELPEIKNTQAFEPEKLQPPAVTEIVAEAARTVESAEQISKEATTGLPEMQTSTPLSPGKDQSVSRMKDENSSPAETEKKEKEKPASVMEAPGANRASPVTPEDRGRSMAMSYLANGYQSDLDFSKVRGTKDFYSAHVRDGKPGGYKQLEGEFRATVAKIAGGPEPAKDRVFTKEEVDSVLGKKAFSDFAKNGIPFRQADAVHALLDSRRSSAGIKEGPDKLDALKFVVESSNTKELDNTRIQSNGKDLATLGEVRQELSKLRSMEEKVKSDLQKNYGDKEAGRIMKSLDLPTVQHLAEKGLNKQEIEAFKAHMNERSPGGNKNWFRTEDALNSVAAINRGSETDKMLGLTASLTGGKKIDGATVYMKVETLKEEYDKSRARDFVKQDGPALDKGSGLDVSSQDPFTSRKEPVLNPSQQKEGAIESGAVDKEKLDVGKNQEKPTTGKDLSKDSSAGGGAENTVSPTKERQLELDR